MKAKLSNALSGGLLIVLASSSQASELSLSAHRNLGLKGETAAVQLDGPASTPFVLFASADVAPLYQLPVAAGWLDAYGHADYSFKLPATLTQSEALVRLRALYVGTNGVQSETEAVELDCSALLVEQFSFDYELEAVPVKAGEPLREQWAPIGLHVRGFNFGSGPDEALSFDSSAPTGGDDDLMTPGPGTGNTTAFGNVMIVAENMLDADADGYVDQPDDAASGGMLLYEWDSPIYIYSVTLLDVDATDGAGAVVRTYFEGSEVESVLVPGLDDNNVQIVSFEAEGNVDELQVEFSGSGAVAEVRFMPCPVFLTFDTTTTGMPMGYEAGEIAGEQWVSEGVLISGVTANPAHPDAVVLFDTANPTGGDMDLQTPGYGPGNTVARRQVLVLADNVVDADADGLVDDPGDTSGGGTFIFDFAMCTTLESGTVLDIDTYEPDCFFEAFDVNGASLGTWPLQLLGDNSSQTVDFGGVPLVRRLELTLCASGALAELVYCPTPGADEEPL